MDLKTLKLELLERIANLDDETRLLALKRLLDGPSTYATPNDHLSIVREGEASYMKLEDRMYTAEEVRKLVESALDHVEAADDEQQVDPKMLTELEERHRQMESREVTGMSWEEVQGSLDADRKKQSGEA